MILWKKSNENRNASRPAVHKSASECGLSGSLRPGQFRGFTGYYRPRLSPAFTKFKKTVLPMAKGR
jgi:hypothetical protein